jgi:FkbM family methyltransferase
MLKSFIRFIRKIIGTDQLMNEILSIQKKNQKQILLLSNAISVLMVDKNIIEQSIVYKKTKEIISLLEPRSVYSEQFIRVGKNNDGGYVMVNNDLFKSSEIAYSFGISNDTSWDEQIANLGKRVFMYDHTIDKLPTQNPNFYFYKIGLTGYSKAPNLKTIDELIVINNHFHENNLLMKMDIEGCEWDVINAVSSATLNKFSQICLEFHNLSPFIDSANYQLIIDVLNKINLTHQSVHVHANSDIAVPHMMHNYILPELLEVTFVRKDIIESRKELERFFPTDIDEATFLNNPDMLLGNFSI